MTVQVAEGTRIPEFRLPAVETGPMKVMALLLRDPNPIHWDVASVQHLGLGDQPVNQGPLNVSYVLNALIRWTGTPSAVRTFTVRFLGNVVAGDEIVASGVVTGVSEVAGRRLAHCDVWLEKADGVRVVQGTATIQLPAS
jgi:acyl dehydratase